MVCPHCRVTIHEDFEEIPLFPGDADGDEEIGWSVSAQLCPACNKPIIRLLEGEPIFSATRSEPHDGFSGVDLNDEYTVVQLWPIGSSRTWPSEVPNEIKEDFLEAANVISISAKASAALSRRCLQSLLVGYANVKAKDLSKQIHEVIESHALSSNVAEQLDAVRNIGNFAAHPQKIKLLARYCLWSPMKRNGTWTYLRSFLTTTS